MRFIEVEVELTTSSTVARSGGTRDWDVVGFPDRSKSADGSYNIIDGAMSPPGNVIKMNYLQRVGFTTPARLKNLPLYAIKVKAIVNGGGPGSDDETVTDTVVYAESICIVKGGSVLTSVDKGVAGSTFTGVETRYYTFSSADLVTLGVVRVSDLLADPANFGAVIGLTSDDTVASQSHYAQVDQLALVFVLIEEEEEMDAYHSGKGGGWEVAAREALPSVATSIAPFANVPDDCTMIELTVRTADVVINWNLPGGSTAATTAIGNTYVAGLTHRLYGNKQTFAAARAIQSGGTATGWITYWKVA